MSRTSTETQAERQVSARGQQTRARIMEAAVRLLWRDGYGAVSVDAICAAADARKGSFYHAFGSKEGLVVAALEAIWAANRGEIEEIYARDLPLIERFRQHLEWMGESQRRLKALYGFVPGTFNIALNIGAPAAVLDISRRFAEEHSSIVLRAISELLESSGRGAEAAPWLADVIRHMISGVNIEARIADSLEPFEALPEIVLALLGLGPPPPAGESSSPDI